MKIIYNKNENIIFYTGRIKFEYVFFSVVNVYVRTMAIRGPWKHAKMQMKRN